MPDRENPGVLTMALRKILDNFPVVGARLMTLLRIKSESARLQVKHIFDTTSDQVREKAEETKRALALRMAVMELEHHLNRLYPQIGKLACDLSARDERELLHDEDLRAKVTLAMEYRERLQALRARQTEQQARKQAQRRSS